MSGTGESVADFAGEERAFRVRLGEIRRIEAKCEAGVGEVGRRLSRALLIVRQVGQLSMVEALAGGLDIRADDVREVIYQGLVGGGMSPGDATALVRREIDERGLRGLVDNVGVALLALCGANEAPEGSRVGEPQAGENPATPEPPSTSN
jgi:hypothetical protein